ncbi:MAG: potassium transporter [Lachnospiraceae bacterium]|nr:potassium transporter [Lachnospiraceae bacterium]
MESILLIIAVIILLCIGANRFSDKFGMPVLLLFILLGIIFGVDGPLGIQFDDYGLTEKVCSIALAFIMFFGGFGIKWSVAKPVVVKSALLSTAGVILTALLTTGFCVAVLKFGFKESFLIGAVLSCTDAASVFSILRSKNLSLKDGTASMLEIESGSNDPVAYMLTILGIYLMNDNPGNFGMLLLAQISVGVIVGVAVAKIAEWIMRKTDIITAGMDTIFITAIVLISYALPLAFNGNGYLSVYLTGIILGNSRIANKNVLVHFFDGITNLSQIVIFFLLGLLATPHRMPEVILPAIGIAAFLAIFARPMAVRAVLSFFNINIRQYTLVSWAGLRGASSIVFAIYVMANGVALEHDIFHIVFMVAISSVAIQGTLLPFIAKKLEMIDENSDVRKTFNDYQEDETMTLMRMYIPKGHNWENSKISEVHIPTGSLALMIKRDGETIIPKGDTVILAEDSIILSVPSYRGHSDIELEEIYIDKKHEWCGKSIEELQLPPNILIAVIKRQEKNIIPRGKTVIQENDIVVTYK